MVEAKRFHTSKYGLGLAVTVFPRGTPLPGVEIQFECPGLTVGGYIYG